MADKYVTLPEGTLYYPKLARPDTNNKDEDIWVADILVDDKEAAETHKDYLRAQFKKEHGKKAKETGGGASCKGLWRPAQKLVGQDEDGDNIYEDTEDTVFRVRVKNVKKKDGTIWDRRPKVWDASKNAVDDYDLLGFGSRVLIKAEHYAGSYDGTPFFQTQPVHILLLEAKPVGGSSEDNPFSDDETSLSNFTSTPESPFGSDGSDEEDDDNGDF